MGLDSVKPGHVFLALAIFWCAWLYTEITEYQDRAKVLAEAKAFMKAGSRFTGEDGAALEKRIKQLEDQLDGSQ